MGGEGGVQTDVERGEGVSAGLLNVLCSSLFVLFQRMPHSQMVVNEFIRFINKSPTPFHGEFCAIDHYVMPVVIEGRDWFCNL